MLTVQSSVLTGDGFGMVKFGGFQSRIITAVKIIKICGIEY